MARCHGLPVLSHCLFPEIGGNNAAGVRCANCHMIRTGEQMMWNEDVDLPAEPQ
jgi:hypothetical protein